MNKIPLTHEELQRLIPRLEKSIEDIVAEQPHEVRGLPPMTVEECESYFYGLTDIAAQRPLTQAECFMHGQLMCCYRMAIQAEMLGKKGRYFVFSEDEIRKKLGQL